MSKQVYIIFFAIILSISFARKHMKTNENSPPGQDGNPFSGQGEHQSPMPDDNSPPPQGGRPFPVEDGNSPPQGGQQSPMPDDNSPPSQGGRPFPSEDGNSPPPQRGQQPPMPDDNSPPSQRGQQPPMPDDNSPPPQGGQQPPMPDDNSQPPQGGRPFPADDGNSPPPQRGRRPPMPDDNSPPPQGGRPFPADDGNSPPPQRGNRLPVQQETGFTNSQRRVQGEVLQAHNKYRSRHCVRPLQLDDDLSRSAQFYAEQLAQSNGLIRGDSRGAGQNIFSTSSSDFLGSIDGKEAVKTWYKGHRFYNFNQGSFSMETGSFTQLAWANSRQLGVGIAYTSDGHTAYIVAQYLPPGNYGNEYQENVLPAQC